MIWSTADAVIHIAGWSLLTGAKGRTHGYPHVAKKDARSIAAQPNEPRVRSTRT